MIPTEGMTPTGRKKLTEFVSDLDRELAMAGQLVSTQGKLSQSIRVETALNGVAALNKKKDASAVFDIASRMINDDIREGRVPARTTSEIVAEAEHLSAQSHS